MDIKNKVALITGGSRGIGLAIVKELLLNGIGHVAILDLIDTEGKETTSKLNSEFGKDRVIFIHTDVTNSQELEDAFRKTKDTFKGLDIVINNAGLFDETKWERMLAINVNAVINGTMLALQLMGKDRGDKGGTIINVSSIYGMNPTLIGPVYVASKFAVLGFDRSIGNPYIYDKTGVRVMSLCPGITDTMMVSNIPLVATSYVGQKLAEEELKKLPFQNADNVGQGVVHILKFGQSGSTWVSEGEEPIYEVKFPHYSTLKG